MNDSINMTGAKFDVIVVGGSYAGLSAAMALGRALRKVLVIDGGKPANRFTPYSHNFLTQDGSSPTDIAALGRHHLEKYTSVRVINDFATGVTGSNNEFIVQLASGESYYSRKLILATGILDLIPDIPGFAACWGKSVLHCPYCHGYEVRGVTTGIVGNGDYAFEFGALISNWTSDLAIYTNGPSSLTQEQIAGLRRHNIKIVDDHISAFVHKDGNMERIVFANGNSARVDAIYARPAFMHHSDIPSRVGCEMTEEGYIKVDASQRTTCPGVFACGDNVARIRTVANAVSMGAVAGMMSNKELIFEDF